jgi:spectinomycin phosphotransferase
VELHDATPVVRDVASRHSLAVPGRAELDAALRDRDTPWHGGPFSEPARRALGPCAADLVDAMARFDDLASRLGGDEGWVVSHGEPHSANVMRTGERLVLVDWDTVALAPPERDLWMVVDSPADAGSYTEATGRHVDTRALALFRAAWDLGDLAAYVSLFRAPHREDADTAKAFGGVTKILARLGR